jgi:hypothetical protein
MDGVCKLAHGEENHKPASSLPASTRKRGGSKVLARDRKWSHCLLIASLICSISSNEVAQGIRTKSTANSPNAVLPIAREFNSKADQ